MTTLPSLPAVPGLSWSRHKKPGFATRVASHVSGRKVRLALFVNPLYEFEANYAGLSSASAPAGGQAGLGAFSLQALMGFHAQMQGQFGTFLYIDPDDNTVTGGAIGAGDGTTQKFVVQRNIGGFVEPVSYVTAVTNVYLNGVPKVAGVDYLFTAPNLLGFASPPGAGVNITADFTFAFQCRFLEDQLDFDEFMSGLYKLDSVKFRSVKANTNPAGAVIPSWVGAYAIGGTLPFMFADFTSQGTTNRYFYNGTTLGQTSAGGSGWSVVSSSIKPAANGFYRCVVTVTIAGSAGGVILQQAAAASGNSFTADGNSSSPGSQTNYLWGAQLEQASVVLSYIPTTSATATRAADSLQIPWTATTATFRTKTVNLQESAGTERLVGTTTNDGPLFTSSATALGTTQNTSGALTESSAVASWSGVHVAGVTGSPSGRLVNADNHTPASDTNTLFSATPADIFSVRRTVHLISRSGISSSSVLGPSRRRAPNYRR